MSPETPNRPRVGIPWRRSKEEAERNFPKMANYQEAVRNAGGEPVLIALSHRNEQCKLVTEMDAFVLPGSPADVMPEEYGEVNKGLSASADMPREETDRAILSHAFAEKKPVLAICYGCQLLNVYLEGTLVQDIRAERPTPVAHGHKDLPPGATGDAEHQVRLERDSRLADISQIAMPRINSSHHQAIAKPGKNLRVTAHSTDGIIEGVEWTGDANWVVGVQWHPERMFGDTFSERLFRDFVAAARGAVVQKA